MQSCLNTIMVVLLVLITNLIKYSINIYFSHQNPGLIVTICGFIFAKPKAKNQVQVS